MLKSYKYRLLPTEGHKAIFRNWMGACRFIYNLGLETKITAWASARKNVTCFDLMRQLTDLKATDAPWLAECPRQSLESSITHLENAYTKFFKGGGFPNFKKRNRQQSMTFRMGSRVNDGKIRLTKIGWIDFIEHRKLPIGEIRTVVVSKNTADEYYVSILLKTDDEIPEKKQILSETAVGIDVGLKTFATLSDGQTFDNPKYLHAQLKRLRIEQRTLARRYQKGKKISEQSKGWHKQKLVVAKLHQKIANQRQDFLHKTSTAIIKQFDTICLEDLNIKGMMQNGNLSKAIGDVSWYEFTRMLEYKSEWYGKNISYIGRFDPSSKICSNCGHLFKELTLLHREWDCEKCGEKHDRDKNAAINIKNFGLRNQPVIANVKQ